jgi:hypothetical protein
MYNAKNYEQQGGERTVIGGEIDIISGGVLKIAGAQVTASAAEINKATLLASTDRVTKIVKVALGALDAGGGVLAWANPESTSIIVTRLVLDITTKATGACTLDAGTTASSATTVVDTLIDGVDAGTAIGTFDNISDASTNGKSRQKLATGKWVTVSMKTGAAAGIVGFAYIHYNTI